MHKEAPIIILSGVVGSGKGTVAHALSRELDLTWVPTHTTRPMRRDDSALSHRIFDTETTFLRHLARGEFIEAVEIAGHRYGLLREDLDKVRRSGKPSLIEMNVDGGIKVDRDYPETLLLFLTVPSQEIAERVAHRRMDDEELAARLKQAAREEKIAKQHYDYLVENTGHHPERAIDHIKQLVLDNFPELQLTK